MSRVVFTISVVSFALLFLKWKAWKKCVEPTKKKAEEPRSGASNNRLRNINLKP